MLSFDRLSNDRACIELDFLERKATFELAMKLSIRIHTAGLLLSNTVSMLEHVCVYHHRTNVHWLIQKADLKPADVADPNDVAVDETVLQLNAERYWLYATVDPDTNRLLHIRLNPMRNTPIPSMFLSEMRKKHQIDDVMELVDGAPWIQTTRQCHGLRFHHLTHGNRKPVERVFFQVIPQLK